MSLGLDLNIGDLSWLTDFVSDNLLHVEVGDDCSNTSEPDWDEIGTVIDDVDYTSNCGDDSSAVSHASVALSSVVMSFFM